MKVNFFFSLGAALAVCLGACTDDSVPSPAVNQGPLVPMTVTLDSIATKTGTGIINETSLGNGVSMGVFVEDAAGGNYDNNDSYKNLMYTSSTVDQVQKWTGTDVLLSATLGKAYAYYPYMSGVADFTAIPLDVTTDNDVLYATATGTINNASPNASFELKHALSLLSVDIVRNTYTGVGEVTAFSVKSALASATGSLNGKTGEITGFTGGGSEIADMGHPAALPQTLPTTDTKTVSRQLMIVPGGTGTADPLTFKVVMDGQTYTAQTQSAVTFEQNRHYKFSLHMNGTEMTLGSVTVTEWGAGNGEGDELHPELVVDNP